MKPTDFAQHLSAFLRNYLPGVKDLSTNTINSYRDTYRLLLIYCRDELDIVPEKITLAGLTDRLVLGFLDWIQTTRHCCVATRNQRLAAVHAFCRYMQLQEPAYLDTFQRVLAIPFKKAAQHVVEYLTPTALQTILAQPNTATVHGRRDATMLSLLYDSGARVQELADLRRRDIRLEEPPVIRLTGKGKKSRYVPLMHNTAGLLKHYMSEHRIDTEASPDQPLFTNRQGLRLTRSGIAYILQKYTTSARQKSASVPVSVTPHTLRHTKAMHLYQSGVALVYIRDLLGHVNISTTDVYARADTEMKRAALENAYPEIAPVNVGDWNTDEELLGWLNSL